MSLRIIPTSPVPERILTRRELLRYLSAFGTALAGARIAEAHPIHKLLMQPERLLDATQKAGDWSPEFLDAHQNESLISLAERILPGSHDAHVNQLIDLLLTVEPPENQKNFAAAIAAIDAESQKHSSAPFKSLSTAQQDEVLTLCSAAKPARPAKEPGSSDFDADDRAPVPGATLRDHFENLKGWIIGAYYSSEAGMRELGWTEGTFFDALPECSHLEGHL